MFGYVTYSGKYDVEYDEWLWISYSSLWSILDYSFDYVVVVVVANAPGFFQFFFLQQQQHRETKCDILLVVVCRTMAWHFCCVERERKREIERRREGANNTHTQHSQIVDFGSTRFSSLDTAHRPTVCWRSIRVLCVCVCAKSSLLCYANIIRWKLPIYGG